MLTAKQEAFTAEYIATGNAVQSALKHYDTDNYNSAHVIACENLQKVTIQDRIKEAWESAGLTPEFITKGLKDVCNSKVLPEVNKALRTSAEVVGMIGQRVGSVHIDNRTQQAISIHSADVSRLESILDRIQDMSKGKRIDARVKGKTAL